MPRQVITKAVTIAGSGYAQPPKTYQVGQVVELSASELAAVTGGGGTARVTTIRDQLGLASGVSNSN